VFLSVSFAELIQPGAMWNELLPIQTQVTTRLQPQPPGFELSHCNQMFTLFQQVRLPNVSDNLTPS